MTNRILRFQGTWRGTVVGDVQVPSATKKTVHHFAMPEGSIGPDDRRDNI